MNWKGLLIITLLIVAAAFSWNKGNENQLATASILNNSDEVEQMAALKVGDKAPEIAQKDPTGKERKLSDLKGKLVLIDFWASWCGPCRRENPNVVKVYNTYNDKLFKNGRGFEIFSVSLDQNKKAWEDAIRKDGLVWENHVSDLKYWRSEPARVYNVNAIPATFLLDGDGTIIAKNLRGGALEKTLKSLQVK